MIIKYFGLIECGLSCAGDLLDYSAVSANPIAPAGVTIDRSVAWPSSYYMYVPAYTASS